MRKHNKASLNTVTLAGNLTNAPKRFYGRSNKEYVLFTVAVNTRGNREPDHIDCVCYGAQADAMTRYTDKGSCVLVEGSISARMVQDGERIRNSQRVLAYRVQFLDQYEPQSNEDESFKDKELYVEELA